MIENKIKETFFICNIDTVLTFLKRNPIINSQYSFLFNTYFPEQKKKLFDRNDQSNISVTYKKIMINALDKNKNFNMFFYYKYLKKIIDQYHLYDLRIIFLVRRKDWKLLACGTIGLHKNRVDTTMSDICVAYNMRRMGLGKRIVDFIIKYVTKMSQNSGINKIFLEVDRNNIIAIKLYKKFGFYIYDDYYKMVKMELRLK